MYVLLWIKISVLKYLQKIVINICVEQKTIFHIFKLCFGNKNILERKNKTLRTISKSIRNAKYVLIKLTMYFLQKY